MKQHITDLTLTIGNYKWITADREYCDSSMQATEKQGNKQERKKDTKTGKKKKIFFLISIQSWRIPSLKCKSLPIDFRKYYYRKSYFCDSLIKKKCTFLWWLWYSVYYRYTWTHLFYTSISVWLLGTGLQIVTDSQFLIHCFINVKKLTNQIFRPPQQKAKTFYPCHQNLSRTN